MNTTANIAYQRIVTDKMRKQWSERLKKAKDVLAWILLCVILLVTLGFGLVLVTLSIGQRYF